MMRITYNGFLAVKMDKGWFARSWRLHDKLSITLP